MIFKGSKHFLRRKAVAPGCPHTVRHPVSANIRRGVPGGAPPKSAPDIGVAFHTCKLPAQIAVSAGDRHFTNHGYLDHRQNPDTPYLSCP